MRLYQIFHARGLYPRQHVGRHSKRNDPKDMSKIIAKSMRAIYNIKQFIIVARRALEEGAAKGRGGKGSIFVWASGNGGDVFGSCLQ